MNICRRILGGPSVILFSTLLLFSLPLFSEEKEGGEGKVEEGVKGGRGRESKPTLIVFNITAERGVEVGAANLLTEYILTEISNLKRYTVIGQNDIDKMLMWETNKQLKNCTDSSCIAQIAGAMGAEYYVVGSIGVMGDNYMVNLKLIDVMRAEVKKRITEVIKKDENAVISSTREIIGKMFEVKEEGRGVRVEKVEEVKVAEKVVEKGGEGKGMGWIGYGMIGVGVIMLGGGGYFTKAAMDARGKYEGGMEDVDRYKSEIDENNRNAVISYVSGGVLVGGGILYTVLRGGGEDKRRGEGIRIEGGLGYIGMRIRY